jgi:hypothetical protein
MIKKPNDKKSGVLREKGPFEAGGSLAKQPARRKKGGSFAPYKGDLWKF